MAVATVAGQQSISQGAALAALQAHEEKLAPTSLGFQEPSNDKSTSHETTHAPTGANTENPANVTATVVPTSEVVQHNEDDHQNSDSDDDDVPSLKAISDDSEESDDDEEIDDEEETNDEEEIDDEEETSSSASPIRVIMVSEQFLYIL